MPNLLVQGAPQWAFLASEANDTRSRTQGVLAAAAGNNLKSGAVLGKITASGKYTLLAPTASDGSQTAAAILCWNTDASAADRRTVLIDRDAEVIDTLLIWPAGITDPQKAAALGQLAALGIKLRQGDPL